MSPSSLLIAEKIGEARAEGDLSENAECHGQRERQGMLQAKINLLADKLARAQIINPADLPKDEIVFGATVRVMDLDLDEEEEITPVGAGDEDYDSRQVLDHQPHRPRTRRKKGGRRSRDRGS